MPRKVWDENIGNWREITGIANCTFEFLAPKSKPRAWRHNRCGSTMKLLPANLDQPEYWYCLTCEHKITTHEAQKALKIS